jgi:putative transposase
MLPPAYPSDRSDRKWAIWQPLLPPAKPGGQPRTVNLRAMVNAIFYRLRGGCAWRLLPHAFPPWSTVYDYFRTWRNDGTWERSHTTRRERLRQQDGREPPPSAAILASQSVKTPAKGGPHGYAGGKKVHGRKRHRLVATLGLVGQAVGHPAHISDRDGGKQVLERLGPRFPRWQKIGADSAYRGKFVDGVQEHFRGSLAIVPHRWTGRPGVWAPADAVIDWEQIRPSGFHVLPHRWLVERTLAWIGRYRRMSKDSESLPKSSEAMIYLTMIRLLVKRLARKAG